MKLLKFAQLFTTCLCVLSLFTSCKKENEPEPEQTGANSHNQWIWVESIGGIAGLRYAPGPNEEVILILKDSSNWSLLNNGKPVDKGGYISGPDRVYFDKPMHTSNLYLQQDEEIQFNSDNLRLKDYGISDGFTHYFISKNPSTGIIMSRQSVSTSQLLSAYINVPDLTQTTQQIAAKWSVTPSIGVTMDSTYSFRANKFYFDAPGTYTISAEIKSVSCHPTTTSSNLSTCYNAGAFLRTEVNYVTVTN